MELILALLYNIIYKYSNVYYVIFWQTIKPLILLFSLLVISKRYSSIKRTDVNSFFILSLFFILRSFLNSSFGPLNCVFTIGAIYIITRETLNLFSVISVVLIMVFNESYEMLQFFGRINGKTHSVVVPLIIFSYYLTRKNFDKNFVLNFITSNLAVFYFLSFIAKIRMEGEWVNYLNNDMFNLVQASIISNANIVASGYLDYIGLLGSANWLQLPTLIIEGGFLLLLVFTKNRRIVIIGILTLIILHIMIWISSGIFFSLWLAVLSALLYEIFRGNYLNTLYKKFYIIPLVFFCALVLRPMFFGPFLGWLDSTFIITTELYDSNDRLLNKNAFKPFHLALTQNRLPGISYKDAGCPTGTFGAVLSQERVSISDGIPCALDVDTSALELFVDRLNSGRKRYFEYIPDHINHNGKATNDVEYIVISQNRISGFRDFVNIKKDTLWF